MTEDRGSAADDGSESTGDEGTDGWDVRVAPSEAEAAGGSDDPESESEAEATGGSDDPESESEAEAAGGSDDPESESEAEAAGGSDDPESESEAEEIAGEEWRYSLEDLPVDGEDEGEREGEGIAGVFGPGETIEPQEIDRESVVFVLVGALIAVVALYLMVP